MASTIMSAWVFSFYFALVNAAKLPPIHWNSSSEIFKNKDGPLLTVKIMDTVDIHCPFYNDTVTRDQAEYSLIYSVSEKGYQDCELDQARAVGMCVSPFGKESIVKLTFREFSPLPNAIDYKPGQTYYFISTSDGSERGLRNSSGGLCLSSKMRLKVKVESRDDDEDESEKVEPKSASSPDEHEISTQDDLDGGAAISDSGNALYGSGRASSATRKQATERRQLTSDSKIIDHEGKEGDDSVGVKFVVDDNKLIPSTPAYGQPDGNLESLTYDPYGLDIGSNSVKRDRQSSEPWRNTKGRPGRYQQSSEKIVLYEIHEMEPQRINRYPSSSASLSRASQYSVVSVFVISFVIARWRFSL